MNFFSNINYIKFVYKWLQFYSFHAYWCNSTTEDIWEVLKKSIKKQINCIMQL